MTEQPEKIAPPKPGDILRRFLRETVGETQDRLADAMQVSRFSINQIINGKRGITPEMAVRLGMATGTTARFWLNIQQRYDLFVAEKRLIPILDQVDVLRARPSGSEMFVDHASPGER